MAAAGVVLFELRIAGLYVRLRFAGRALVPLLTPALAHLQVRHSGNRPALTIDLWDGASTAMLPPRFPWGDGDIGPRGEILGYSEAGLRAVFHGGVAASAEDFTAATIFDQSTSTARFFVLSPDRVPWYERAAPLRAALHYGLSSPCRVLVHAGVVGAADRGVLLAGPGGSGKSTTAVEALLAGFDYLGDDYVVADLEGARPVAHSLYATAKLGPAWRTFFPTLPAQCLGPAGGKQVIDVFKLQPDALRESIPLVAVVLPRLCPGGATCLRPASPGEALLGLAPSTLFQAPRRDGAVLSSLAELVRRVPAYVLELGGGPNEGVRAMARLMEP